MKNLIVGSALIALAAVSVRAEMGLAAIKGTAEKSPISGTVTLTDVKDGLKVEAKLSGVPAGLHGFHIHEFGTCDDSGKAAGGHFNPHNAMHGDVVKSGPKKAHAGDMGNITAGPDGSATLEVVIPKTSLSAGKNNVAGRAIILHEKADDFGQPTGNAGGRIGCGLIAITAK